MIHPPIEPLFIEKEVEHKVPLLDEDGEIVIKVVQKKDEDGNVVKKLGKPVMVGAIQYKTVKKTELVPKMVPTKIKHPHSHKMIDHEI